MSDQIENMLAQMIQGDVSGVEKSFNQIFAQKVSDRMDQEKAQVMANMMGESVGFRVGKKWQYSHENEKGEKTFQSSNFHIPGKGKSQTDAMEAKVKEWHGQGKIKVYKNVE